VAGVPDVPGPSRGRVPSRMRSDVDASLVRLPSSPTFRRRRPSDAGFPREAVWFRGIDRISGFSGRLSSRMCRRIAEEKEEQ